MLKIFICTSFSSKIDSSGAVLSEHRAAIESLLVLITKLGHTYFCAIEDEGWRITEGNPATEFKRDLDHIKESDIMIALLEDSISAGVQLEIGYMLNEIEKVPSKKLVLAHPSNTELAWSNQAISTLPNVNKVSYSTNQDIINHLALQNTA